MNNPFSLTRQHKSMSNRKPMKKWSADVLFKQCLGRQGRVIQWIIIIFSVAVVNYGMINFLKEHDDRWEAANCDEHQHDDTTTTVVTTSFPRPYSYHLEGTQSRSDDVPFLSTIREETYVRPHNISTPNFYHMMNKSDCLPIERKCNKCLRNETGATCHDCASACPCYCKTLCRVRPNDKFVSKRLLVSPPKRARDPGRLIPRIIHQTWFEPVTKEKYPNMSRLIESWKQTGWDYRFYNDTQATTFLSDHFPPEVGEAYNVLKPGAFKADLFRYCALLIYGGVYADMDVMLESHLDSVISDDVGFIIPIDTPGILTGRRMCLWNGLIASAPAHPFIAKVIDHVVNNIRNRFTSIDIDNLLCPNPELSISRKTDILFTSGPCILGASINDVLGRHKQTEFTPGDLHDGDRYIPGRSIILNQNKEDMGAHRFTWGDRNLIIAATDMPDYDDREKLDTTERNNDHYSKQVHVRKGVYGLENLYTNLISSDERLEIEIVTTTSQ